MTLLITIFAAIITTVLWYRNLPKNTLRLGNLSLMYWGASLMWLVDGIFEYSHLRENYFTPGVKDMLNDTYLGLSVVALGLTAWLIALIIKDPKGVIKTVLFQKNQQR